MDYLSYIAVESMDVEPGNIAGVAVRTLKDLTFRRTAPDLWATPAWLDSGLSTLEQLFRLRIERRLLEEQHRLLAEELRTTSQRVNLFEKVKIPECRENIRRINIFIGDENTSAVVRSKIAKGKSVKKAHPAYGDGDQIVVGEAMDLRLRRLMDFGLQGVEAYYSGFTPVLRKAMLAFAEKYGLYVTAGSDYHGQNKMIELGDTGLDRASDGPGGLTRFIRKMLEKL